MGFCYEDLMVWFGFVGWESIYVVVVLWGI